MSEIHKAKPINSTKHITKCLQGYLKSAGGFVWKYKEQLKILYFQKENSTENDEWIFSYFSGRN